MISLGRETMTYKFYNSVFLSHGLDLSPDTEAATADQILPLVKCELGLAFLPQPMAAPSILKKEIVQIPLKDLIILEINVHNIFSFLTCHIFISIISIISFTYYYVKRIMYLNKKERCCRAKSGLL